LRIRICASVRPVSQEATEVTEIGFRKNKLRDGIEPLIRPGFYRQLKDSN
jgi:hypothetical protein